MDAEIVVSALTEKLRNELTAHQDPILETQVQTAINNLLLLKRRLKYAEDNEASPAMARLLQEVYAAEDGADTLLTRRGIQIKGKSSSKKKFLQWSCLTRDHEKKKTFADEFREHLSSYDRLVAMTSDIKDDVGSDNETRSSPQNDHKGQQSQQHQGGRISDFCLKEEKDIVGLEDPIDNLLQLTLTGPRSSSKVIAVVGEGGSGKTTLMRSVYNRLLIDNKFDHYAWVCVPSLFRARYVFADILKQLQESQRGVTVNDATFSEAEFIQMLNRTLESRIDHGYLLVIEDVESHQVYDVIQGALRSLSHNGRIIITSRDEDVAKHAAKGSILNLCPLDSERSWELFLKKVQIAEDVFNNSTELNELKEKTLKVCGGLPLRIVLLGGLLSTKKVSYDEWSRVIEQAEKMGDISLLSYQDLPSQVKPCFLYMGLFPREYEIPVRRLIHLWISEGLVAPLDSSAEIIPEDLAETFLEELVIRNMIHVRWRLDGSPKTCRMHGVLYDIFYPKAADVGFVNHQFQSTDKQPEFAVRRLASCLGIKSNSRSLFPQVKRLRSYVAFDTRIPGRPAMEIGMLLNKNIIERGFGLLKVLDLEGVYKPMLPNDAVRKLLFLSYLGLRSTAIDFLPPSVGILPCLETLDVKHTIIHDLPSSTWEAKKLRHVYLNWSCSSNFNSSLLPSGPPLNLHTLWGLSISTVDQVDCLKLLTGLRKLGLTCTSTSVAEATAEWVSQLTKLHSLKLRAIRKYSHDKLELILPNIAMHHKLQNLYLLGRLALKGLLSEDDFLPKLYLRVVEFPTNLRNLTLSGSSLEDDPMAVLGRLPQLNILRLLGECYEGETMKCLRGGFPKLHVLKLWKLGLEKWTVEEGAMPCLNELEIRHCNFYKETPRLQHLTTLKQVQLLGAGISRDRFPKGVIIK